MDVTTAAPHPLEAALTHLTGVIFVLLGIATWALRWLVGHWTMRVRSAAA